MTTIDHGTRPCPHCAGTGKLSNRHRNGTQGRIRRVQWLAKHPDLWGKPADHVFRELKNHGLLAPTTGILDMRIGDLVRDAKKMVGR